MVRKLKVLPLLVLLVLVAGCKSDPYTVSMKASLDVSNGVSDGIKLLADLNQAGTLSKSEVADFAGYLGDLTVLNQKFRQDVQALHTNGHSGKIQYLNAAQIFVAGAKDPKLFNALHIVNPKSQQQMMVWLQTFQLVLDGIQTAINAAKGA